MKDNNRISQAGKPAIAAYLGMHLTAGQIGICHCYTSWHDAPQMHVVFKTTDDDQAIRILQAYASRRDREVGFQLLALKKN